MGRKHKRKHAESSSNSNDSPSSQPDSPPQPNPVDLQLNDSSSFDHLQVGQVAQVKEQLMQSASSDSMTIITKEECQPSTQPAVEPEISQIPPPPPVEEPTKPTKPEEIKAEPKQLTFFQRVKSWFS